MSALRAAVVGTRGIGAYHARLLRDLPDYNLVGICDRNPEALASAQPEETGARGYLDFGELLETEKPDVVAVATDNASHFRVSMMAVDAGVRGIYLEKPMTVHLGDARELVAACQRKGIALAVNHQRRLLPELVTMRRLLASGAIGEVQLIRACCAGDFLSDGTHAVDSVRYLVGDVPAEWVAAQVFRAPTENDQGGEGFDKAGGKRFGHVVDDAAMAVVGFAGGVRAEFMTGELFPEGRWYQDYEAFGTKGRLWRPPDNQEPRLRIDRGNGVWEAVPLEGGSMEPMTTSYELFAETVRTGVLHPLDGATQGLSAMEICSAVYESARLHQRMPLPLTAERFGLELMVEAAR